MAEEKKQYDFSSFDEHPAIKDVAPSAKYDFSAFDTHPAAKEEPSSLQDFVENVPSMGLNLKPILGGAAQTGMEAITGITSPKDILERYRQLRDAESKREEEATQRSPWAAGAGKLVGSLIPAALTGGASEAAAPGQLLNEGSALARAQASISPEIAQATGLGAKYGAAQAATNSPADLTKGEIAPLANDVLSGATTGALTGSLASRLANKAPTLEGTADALENSAAKRAINATGGTAGERKQLIQQGKLESHGQNLLEKNDYLDTPLVTAGSRPEAILERAQQMKQNSGQAIGDVLNKLDESGVKPGFFNPADILPKLQAIKERFMKNGVIRRSTEGQYNEIEKVIDDISQYGPNPISFKDADEIKQLVSNLAYDDRGKLTNNLMGEVRGIVNDGIEQAADKVAAGAETPELSQQYLKAKQAYGTAKTAERMALGQTARNLTNRDLGITDYIAGGAMAAAHGTPVGLATAGITKAAKAYGNSASATALNAAAAGMRSINKQLVSAPQKMQSIGEGFVASGDPLKASLGKVLVEASKKDDIGRNALMFSLMQNDKYREIMRTVMGNGDSNGQ